MKETLVCTLCVTEKSISEFYKNPGMPSGHANQCKECVKKRAKLREHTLRQSSDWQESEKIRSREKYHRLNYKERAKELNKNKPWKNSTYKNLYKRLKTKGLINDGQSIHHWNYNLIKDYFILDNELHRKIHTKLFLDNDSLCFKDDRGVLLDTREKHQYFIDNFTCEY